MSPLLLAVLIGVTANLHEITKTYEIHEAVLYKNSFRVLREASCLRDDPSQGNAVTMPRTLQKGDQSNIDEARQVLVRTDAEWDALWARHSPDRPKPKVDFSKEMIVGVFMGSRPNAGFTITITSATAAAGVLLVRYNEKSPGRDTVAAQILTFPYHLVVIPKADVKDVKFEKVE